MSTEINPSDPSSESPLELSPSAQKLDSLNLQSEDVRENVAELVRKLFGQLEANRTSQTIHSVYNLYLAVFCTVLITVGFVLFISMRSGLILCILLVLLSFFPITAYSYYQNKYLIRYRKNKLKLIIDSMYREDEEKKQRFRKFYGISDDYFCEESIDKEGFRGTMLFSSLVCASIALIGFCVLFISYDINHYFLPNEQEIVLPSVLKDRQDLPRETQGDSPRNVNIYLDSNRLHSLEPLTSFDAPSLQYVAEKDLGGPEKELNDSEKNEKTQLDEFPRHQSVLIFGLAFLGSYVWGFQYVLRRYITNDLSEDVYYSLAYRFVFASFIVVFIFNAVSNFPQIEVGDTTIGLDYFWPSLAFFGGMFPSRLWRWFKGRIPYFSNEDLAPVIPLEAIEGVDTYDAHRLTDEGINDCYDLSMANCFSLILNTPYDAPKLVDWILQAKLAVLVGQEKLQELRDLGVKTSLDFCERSLEKPSEFASISSLSQQAIEQINCAIKQDRSLHLLDEILRAVYGDCNSPRISELMLRAPGSPPSDGDNGRPGHGTDGHGTDGQGGEGQ